MPSTPLTNLADRKATKQPTFAAWMVTGAPASAEALLRAGFDAAVFDMQHGAHDIASASAGIASCALLGKPGLVRIPVGDFAAASRLCDAGAAAVIAPMINSPADAKDLVAFTKYPPVGERSWGPGRAVILSGLGGQAYLEAANGLHAAIAMIETRAAVDAVDAILAVPGIDGVLVGPYDLSIALSKGRRLDQFSAEVDEALDRIAASASAAGKIAAVFCSSGAHARNMAARGFDLMAIMTDLMLLEAGARVELGAARDDAPAA